MAKLTGWVCLLRCGGWERPFAGCAGCAGCAGDGENAVFGSLDEQR